MAKRRNFHREMASVLARPSDIISNLPANVIETILMYLPTRDAVRTSILTRKWRYRWAKLPQLILDEMLWNKSVVKHSAARTTVAMILCQLLLHHEGPINKFTLSIRGLESCPEIDNLIFFLLRNGIQDLTLDMRYERYRLPLSFFTCQQLRHLSLRYCLIETIPAFKGFSRLITLKLCEVNINAKVLGSLISSCPLLELLDLQIFYFYDLEIDAPNLKTFSFSGFTDSIIFKNAPLLASVSIVRDKYLGENYYSKSGTYNFVEFFHGLPVLEKLHLDYLFFKSLVAGEVPTRLPTTLVYLKDLKLFTIMLDQLDELSFVLCLVRSSPNLKHIDIKASTTNVVLELLKEQDFSDVMLNELKEVKLKDVTGTRPHLELIKLLLAKSPNLKRMLIQPGDITAAKTYTILKELGKFRRASKKAIVIYENRKENQVWCLRSYIKAMK